MRIDLDPDSSVIEEQYAVVYCARRSRDRFPEGSVHLVDSAAQALAQADPDNKRYAALVVGPSRSSEGLRLYYLLQWLDQTDAVP
jgi:hypothetical protein